MLVILWIALLLVVVVPVGLMFFYSFVSTFPVIGQVQFTFEHYSDLFADLDLLLEISKNTAIYAAGTTFLALGIGGAMALLVEKYFPESKLQLLILLPYGIPSVASLAGWVILLGDNGFVTRAIRGVLGLSELPFTIYSLGGMIWVEGLHTAPIAYLLLLPAVKSIPASMEEASFTAGGSRVQTLRRVLLPVVKPAILSTGIFIFARTLATVATPSILGVPERIYTFGSAIPNLFLAGTTLSYSKALSFSVLLTVVTAVPILYYMRITADTGKFTTVTGQGDAQSTQYPTDPGRRITYFGFILLYITVAGILPLLTVVWDSVYPNYQLTLDVSQFTLEYYAAFFAGSVEGVSNGWRVFANTMLVGVLVPTSAMLLGLLIAFGNQSLRLPTSRALSFLAAVTLAVPGIAKGLGFLVAFIRTPLYGTIGLLILGFHGHALPIAMRYASPALTKLGSENFEVATVAGDRAIGTFKRIAMPLVSDDFVAGWMHIYVSVIRNVPIAILLYATGSEVLAVELLLVMQAGYFKTASTLAVIITVLSLGPYMVLQYVRLTRIGTDQL